MAAHSKLHYKAVSSKAIGDVLEASKFYRALVRVTDSPQLLIGHIVAVAFFVHLCLWYLTLAISSMPLSP